MGGPLNVTRTGSLRFTAVFRFHFFAVLIVPMVLARFAMSKPPADAAVGVFLIAPNAVAKLTAAGVRLAAVRGEARSGASGRTSCAECMRVSTRILG